MDGKAHCRCHSPVLLFVWLKRPQKGCEKSRRQQWVLMWTVIIIYYWSNADGMIKDIGRQWSGTCRLLQSRDWQLHTYIWQTRNRAVRYRLWSLLNTPWTQFPTPPEMSSHHLVVWWLQNLLTFVLWIGQLKQAHKSRSEHQWMNIYLRFITQELTFFFLLRIGSKNFRYEYGGSGLNSLHNKQLSHI